MKESEYIAALDLGTSKIIGMAARKNDQGMLSILAAEKTKPEGCIRRGAVYNINDTVTKARSLFYPLNRKLPVQVGKVYVGIGGQSIHMYVHTIKRNMSGDVVSKETIDSLYEECKSYKPEGWDVLAIVSPEFLIDGKAEAKPVGVACQAIEAAYRLVLGRPALLANLNKSIKDRIMVDIAGYFITPLASAEAVLTQSEKEKGCALVEFGAGVTYVSVYKNNILRHLVTIPLGGDVITKDLCDMNLAEDEAELLKTGGNIQNEDFDFAQFETILQARCQEIVDNIVEQIHQSGYAGRLGAGIAVTGGGSNLIDLRDMLKERTGMEVRQATTKKTLVNTLSDWASDPACSAVIGMLALGDENCAKVAREETVRPGRNDLFNKDKELKEAEERRKRELEEQKEREKEEKRKKKEREEEEKRDREKSKKDPFEKLRKRFDKVTNSLFGDEQDANQNSDNDTEESNNNQENK